MNSLLPVYTKPLPVSSDTLIHNFFSKVARHVIVPECQSAPTPSALRKILHEMKNELSIWEKEIGKLLPFENLSEEDRRRIAYLEDTIDHYNMALFGYHKKIDMAFLAEKKGELPYFGVTDTQNKGMRITANKRSLFSEPTFNIHPDLPEDLAGYFSYVTSWLAGHYKRDQVGKVYISASPSGRMPDQLKQRLRVSQQSGLFNGAIYVVFDAEWQLNKELAIVRDPLIIGRSYGEYSRRYSYYLIGMYDPTPMEEWVASTHAKRPSL